MLSVQDNKHNFTHAIAAPTLDHGAYTVWLGVDSQYIGSIYLSGIDENGNLLPGWTNGPKTISLNGNFFAPVVTASEDSGAIAAWFGNPGKVTSCYIYIQKYSRDGVALWNGSIPVQIGDSVKYHYKYPVIISDKHKGVYIVYARYDSTDSPAPLDVMMTHIDSSGYVAKGWYPTGSPVAVNPNLREYYPRIVLSNDESALYISYTVGPIEGASVKLKKFNSADGTVATGWSDTGIVVTPGPNVFTGVGYDQWLFCDKQNNVAIFWNEARSTAYGEIYMQRFTPEGTKLLNPAGVLIDGLEAFYGVIYSYIMQDAEGNYLLTDNNYHEDNSIDVNAVKISAGGSILWYKSPLTRNQASAYPKPASDGKGGMYAVYINYVSGTLNAVALDSTGKFENITVYEGNVFGYINTYDVNNQQYDFDVINGKPTQAIAFWNMISNKYFGIYTCNVLPDGTTCALLPNSIAEHSPNNNIDIFPNPCSASTNIKINISENSTVNIKIFDAYGSLIVILLTASILQETMI